MRETKIWNDSGWTCETFYQTEQRGGCLAVAELFCRTCLDHGTAQVTCQLHLTVAAVLTAAGGQTVSASVEGCF